MIVRLLLCLAITVNAIAASIQWDYRGCYKPRATYYALAHVAGKSDKMTTNACAEMCSQKNYKLFGLAEGFHCVCDNSVAEKAHKVADSRCEKKCPADRSEKCGSGHATRVLEIIVNIRKPEIIVKENSNDVYNWETWSPWGACSETCGLKGRRRRTRKCFKHSGQRKEPAKVQNCGACPPSKQQSEFEKFEEESCNTRVSCHEFKWKTWASWSLCSEKCGPNGKQKRIRQCLKITKQNGGTKQDVTSSSNCPGNLDTEHRSCNTAISCSIFKWSDWSRWSTCTKSCGPGGTKKRFRKCLKITGSKQEDAVPGKCTGHHEDSQSCNAAILCPVFKWSDWSKFNGCTKTCGPGGTQQRFRKCLKITGSRQEEVERQKCPGNNHIDTQSCNTAIPCHKFIWSDWSKWSICSKTCGPSGTQKRLRKCLKVTGTKQEVVDRDKCPGKNHADSQSCNTENPCPIFKWSDWSKWETCTKSCGPGGIQKRLRKCLKITGSKQENVNRENCPGKMNGDIKPCNTDKPCPLLKWSDWSSWSACTKTCGTSGTQKRVRKCLKITGSKQEVVDLQMCPGHHADMQPCNKDKLCHVFKWSDWSTWSACTKTCGQGGTQKRFRKCLKITGTKKEEVDREKCPGKNHIDSQFCNAPILCFTYKWSEWTKWDTCTKTCGPGGTQKRSRKCLKITGTRKEEVEQKKCPGNYHSDVQFCNAATPCPVIKLTPWSTWNVCTKTCGPGGIMKRVRKCVKITGTKQEDAAPEMCPGFKLSDMQSCNTAVPCHVFKWSAWSKWDACTKTCGPGGIQKRLRTCLKITGSKQEAVNRELCPGKMNGDIKPCNTATPCPVYTWTEWAKWNTCTKTCGPGGTQKRFRKCLKITGSKREDGDLKMCAGQNHADTQSCNTAILCYVFRWSPWSTWGACTKTCGLGGTQKRMRKCLKITGTKQEDTSHENCPEKNQIDTQFCSNVKACYVHRWSEWTTWSMCTKTCGPGGTQKRLRKCLKITGTKQENADTKNCPGHFHTDTQFCNAGIPCHVFTWTEWMEWNACTKTCGAGGTRMRLRKCLKITGTKKEEADRQRCPGMNHVNMQSCNTATLCHTFGWSDWSAWNTCTKTCGTGGTQKRFRKCLKITGSKREDAALNKCPGQNHAETKSCTNAPPCYVFKWSDWSTWSACTKTCGEGGTQKRFRKCLKVTGSKREDADLKRCPGQNHAETKSCNSATPCPTYKWSQWSKWNTCSRTCGPDGIQKRLRKCLKITGNKQEDAERVKCPGQMNGDIKPCNTAIPCHVFKWAPWSTWSACTKTCGLGGTQKRLRKCLKITGTKQEDAAHENCSGNHADTKSCNTATPCSMYKWTDWSIWNSCTKTCGKDATRKRFRKCLKITGAQKEEAERGKCPGQNDSDLQLCKESPCPINVWVTWLEWSPCSSSCGPDGKHTRTRQCKKIMIGAKDQIVQPSECPGSDTITECCNTGIVCH